MITDTIKKKMALFLREMYGATTGKMVVGTGGGSTNPLATELDVPISTVANGSAITSTSSDDKVVEFKATFTGSTLQGYTIREMGVFGSLPTDAEMAIIETSGYDFSPVETVMLSRVNFDAIGNFSTSDTVEVIFTMEVE
tara:strand:+ start:105 stop:524 length:420 start_codon:yes stop_codon:yes gene_type:complete